jgi:hypothetical protein
VKSKAYAVICVVCAVVGGLFASPLEASEFSGGTVTGPLLSVHSFSLLLFLLSALVTFFLPRIAAAMSLCAVAASLPLYLFFLAPGLLRAVFGGEWSVPAIGLFAWNAGAAAAIAVSLFVAVTSVRSLRARRALR